MNVPPLSSFTLVTPGHTNDGVNGCELMAFLSVPAAFPAHVNDCAAPAQPLIRHSSAQALPACCGGTCAKTARNRSAPAAGALQLP
jgi:hypothetical protein